MMRTIRCLVTMAAFGALGGLLRMAMPVDGAADVTSGLPPVHVAFVWAAALPWLVPAAASLFGGILGNKKQTQTSTSTTTPTLDPAYGPIQSMLLQQIQQRMTNPSKLPSGYEAGQISSINNTYNQVGQSLDNRLTARGLGTSPVAGAGAATLEAGRGGDIVRMQQGLPLIERQMQNDDLAQAMQMLGYGRGTTVTSTATTPSNMLGGAATSLSSMLAYLYGKGALGGTATPWTQGNVALDPNLGGGWG